MSLLPLAFAVGLAVTAFLAGFEAHRLLSVWMSRKLRRENPELMEELRRAVHEARNA